MKVFGYLFVVLVLSTVAANARQAPQGQAPKNGGLLGASSKAEGQGPGSGRGSSSINGTGMGTQH